MNADAELAGYWQESASWEADRIRQWRESAHIWRWVATAGWTCALGVAAAIVMLLPLKRVEPYVIRVDSSTGIVDVVPEYDARARPAQIVTRYLLTHYVSVCQRFNFAMAESDYTECGAFQTAQRNQVWYAQWKRSNPESPLNLYKDGTVVQATVTSVIFLQDADHQPGLAQVRYLRRIQPSGDAAEQVTHWIASIRYQYTQPARDARQRTVNPLGFRILDFHAEQEVGSMIPGLRHCASFAALGAVLTVCIGSPLCIAEVVPAAAGADSRIRVADYDPGQVYVLQGRVGYQIDLQFDPGESFVGLAAGDIEGLTFVAQGSHLFLKPRATGVVTNLTVLTSKRQYQFDYSVQVPAKGSADHAMYVVQFRYPRSVAAAAAASIAARGLEHHLEQAPENRSHNTDYWFCGTDLLRPAAAWDDGVQTHLLFGQRAEQPAIFVRNDDGTESLLNFSIESGEVIIHRIARRLILRRGGLTGCIVNKGFTGAGERLPSGTIAPDVRRTPRQEP